MMIKLVIGVLLFNSVVAKKHPKARLSFLFPPNNGGKTAVACLVYSGESPFEINWFKNDIKIQGDGVVHIDKLRDSSILTIEPMSSDHNGKYTCNVKNLYGTDKPVIEIAVEGPPSWKFKQQDTKSKPNGDVILRCSATGHPKPKVTWKKFENLNWIALGDDKLIGKISDDEIKISNLHKKHEGKYGCEISNGFGPNLWNEFNIDIIAPKAGQISSMSNPKEGDSATFGCKAKSGDKPLYFKWFKNAEVINNQDTIRIEYLTKDSAILVIDPISVNHNGNYTCVISNIYGRDSSSIQISIEGPPKWLNRPDILYNVHINDQLRIPCSAVSSPIAEVILKMLKGSSWEVVDDGSIKRVENQIFIPKVEKDDEGRYGCEISNGIEPKLWTEFDIKVIDPKVAPFASIVKPVIGGKTSFTCQSLAGSPPLLITWFKNGQLINESVSTRIRTNEDSSILIMDSISSSHSGNYTCKISNRYGYDSYSSELLIEGPPVWVEKPTNIKSEISKMLTIRCIVSGYPKPKVQLKKLKGLSWMQLTDKDKIIMINRDFSNGEFQILSASPDHEGRYGCAASNGIEPDLWTEFDIIINGKTFISDILFT